MTYDTALAHKYATLAWAHTKEADLAIGSLTKWSANGWAGRTGEADNETMLYWQTLAKNEVAHICGSAPCYYVEPEIANLLYSVAPLIPDWTLTDEILHSPSGYVWLGEPLRQVLDVRGWLEPGEHAKVDAVTMEMTSFMWCKRYVWSDGDDVHTQLDRYPQGVKDAKAIVDSFFFVRYPQANFGSNPRQAWGPEREGIPAQFYNWTTGLSIEGFRSVTETGNPQDKVDDVYLRFLATFFSFLSDSIIVPSTQRAGGEMLQRLKHKYPERPEEPVRVIALRKRIYSHKEQDGGDGGDGEHRDIEWTCRWTVGMATGGFWRNQWYPSLGRHQPRWIMPYVKGPEDKPLKVLTPAVYSVSR